MKYNHNILMQSIISQGKHLWPSLKDKFQEFFPSYFVLFQKVDILVNNEKVDAMSFITHSDKAFNWGKSITEELKKIIPRHLFRIA